MKSVFKLYSILSHLLCLILFFFLGILFAKWIEAGKGQMLAAGAIVLSYGIVGSLIGLCLSVFIFSRLHKKNIIRLNLINLVIILSFWGYFYNSYQKRKKEKTQEQEIQYQKKATSKVNRETALLLQEHSQEKSHVSGIGIFSPITQESAY